MNTKKRRATRGNFSWETVTGRLRLIVPAKHSPTGKQKRIALEMNDTLENRREADEIIERIHAHIKLFKDYDPEKLHEYIWGKSENTLNKPEPTPAKEPSLDQLWHRYVTRKSPNWSPVTIKITIKTVESHINKLTTKKLSDASKIEGELFHLSLGSRYIVLCYISACCDWAVHSKLILHNPFRVIVEGMKPPKSDTDPDPFTRKEMERIIEGYTTHPRYNYFTPFVIFLFLTGCRTGEAVALLWKNVTEDYIVFCESILLVRGKHIHRHGTKTEKSRKFPRNSKRLNALLEQLKPEKLNPDDFVFQQPNGKHIHRQTFFYSWYGLKNKKSGQFTQGIVSKLANKTEEEGGIDHYRCPYSTRHTFITLALEAMAQKKQITPSDISQLAKYVGNSAAMIYQHYLGRSGNEQLVNIDLESQTLSQTPGNDKPTSEQLQAQLVAAKKLVAELSALVQTEHSQAVTPSVPPETEPSAPPAPSRNVTSHESYKPELSEAEVEQLAEFAILEEIVNPEQK